MILKEETFGYFISKEDMADLLKVVTRLKDDKMSSATQRREIANRLRDILSSAQRVTNESVI